MLNKKLRLLIRMEVEVVEKIWNDEFGGVYRVKDTSSESQFVLKAFTDDIDMNKLNQEVELLRKYQSKFTFSSFNLLPEGISDFQGKKCLISDYFGKESISDVLNHETGNNNESSIDDGIKMIWIYGIAKGIKFLYDNQIAHGNLKTENIYIDENKYPHILNIGKAEDLHFTKLISNYTSPEIMESKEKIIRHDLISYGLIISQILAGPDIFSKINNNAGVPAFPDSIPAALINLIQKCFAYQLSSFADVVEYLESGHSLVQIDLNYSKYITQLPPFPNESYDYLAIGNSFDNERKYFQAFHCYAMDHFSNHNEQSEYKLGYYFENGYVFSKDYVKASKFYNLASEQNNLKAKIRLGNLYLNGKGVSKDYGKALELFEQAAEQKESESFYYIGTIYENGFGVEQNYIKAAEYYQQGADIKESNSLYHLGKCYIYGRGVENDITKGIKYWTLAAEQNYVNAVFDLGFLYDRGNGVEKDKSKSFNYYLKAADLGDSTAQVNIGVAYETGDGVNADQEKAIHYYKMAAGQKNPKGFLFLGMCHEDQGELEQAVEYYQKAADLNDPIAQFYLAICFKDGDGVDVDYEKAIKYFELSAS